MTVCYFGIYNPDYPRNRLFIKGLRQNGAEVLECNARGRGVWKYMKLVFRHFFIRDRYDVMIVGFPGQTVMPLARRLTSRPIIFDTFLSLFDSEVFDRKQVAPDSAQARRLYLVDKRACELADTVLVDTTEHIRYFAKQFGLDSKKFYKIPVGTDDELFFPQKKISGEFVVHTHGKYIPLQGIEYIVRAAEMLKDKPITFRIVGRGQEYQRVSQEIKNRDLQNIVQVGMVPYEDLPKLINDSDVCLGIFGESEKTMRVIPNKVVEYLACGKAVITAESPAAKELLTDKLNVRFCKSADSVDLAEKVMELHRDKELRNALGKRARELFLDKLTPEILGKQLYEVAEKISQP